MVLESSFVSSEGHLAVGAAVGHLVQTGDAEWNPEVEAGNAAEDAAEASYGATDEPLETTATISGSEKRKESFNLKSI